MKKVFAYIDGFNVYHNLKTHIKIYKLDKSLKWLNLKDLIGFFIDKHSEELSKISFFSALPKKNQFSVNKYKNHKLYYNVLKSAGINIVNGRFATKNKYFTCKKCSHSSNISTYEEKETDVSLAINIISDVLTVSDLDRIILLSADTDFIPVVRYVLENTDKKVTVLFPLGHKHSTEFDRIYDHNNNPYNNYNTKEIKKFHIEKSLFPDEVHFDGNIYRNPYISI